MNQRHEIHTLFVSGCPQDHWSMSERCHLSPQWPWSVWNLLKRNEFCRERSKLVMSK